MLIASEIVSLVQSAQRTQNALIQATGSSASYDAKELVRLRGQFQSDMLAISNASRRDATIGSIGASSDVFRKRHQEMQNRLSAHQADWMLYQIDADWEGYQRATSELKKAQEEYFEWAIEFLER